MHIDDDDQQEAGQTIQLVEEIRAQPDPLLVALVGAANQAPATEVKITLQVSGVTVSGTLVAGSRFFEEMDEWLTRNGDTRLAEALAKPAAEMMRELHDVSDDDFEPPDFIHLKDARVFSSGDARPLPRTLWRGRLSHVSGWSLGSLEVSVR